MCWKNFVVKIDLCIIFIFVVEILLEDEDDLVVGYVENVSVFIG